MRTPYRKPGKYSLIKPDFLFTKDKFGELERKLETLKNLSRPQAIYEVKRLAELGDFSENVEYQLAKGKLRGINSAITNLEKQITNAVIIEPQKQTDQISLGHTITVESGKKQKKYLILGSSETDPKKGIISHNSPLGAMLLGKKINETIKLKIAEKEIVYKIINIE